MIVFWDLATKCYSIANVPIVALYHSDWKDRDTIILYDRLI